MVDDARLCRHHAFITTLRHLPIFMKYLKKNQPFTLASIILHSNNNPYPRKEICQHKKYACMQSLLHLARFLLTKLSSFKLRFLKGATYVLLKISVFPLTKETRPISFLEHVFRQHVLADVNSSG